MRIPLLSLLILSACGSKAPSREPTPESTPAPERRVVINPPALPTPKEEEPAPPPSHIISTHRVHARAEFSLPSGTFQMTLFYEVHVELSGDVHARAFADIIERSESTSSFAKASGGAALAPVHVKPIPTPRRDSLRLQLKRGPTSEGSEFSAVFIDYSSGAPKEVRPSVMTVESFDVETYP
jgi:hypothetical protein